MFFSLCRGVCDGWMARHSGRGDQRTAFRSPFSPYTLAFRDQTQVTRLAQRVLCGYVLLALKVS